MAVLMLAQMVKLPWKWSARGHAKLCHRGYAFCEYISNPAKAFRASESPTDSTERQFSTAHSRSMLKSGPQDLLRYSHRPHLESLAS